MKNVEVKVSKANVMTITVDLNKDFGASKSGKTTIVASTEGNERMNDNSKDEFMIGMNVFRYPGK